MIDAKGTDDKITAVHGCARCDEAADLPPHRPEEIGGRLGEYGEYKVLEKKTVDVDRIDGRTDADRVIRDAVRLYRDRIAPPRPELDATPP